MELGAGRFWSQYRGQQIARGREKYATIQVDRNKSEHPHRVRAANRKVFLALGELRRPDACRFDHLHSQPESTPQSLEAPGPRIDAGTGPRKSDLRADCGQ